MKPQALVAAMIKPQALVTAILIGSGGVVMTTTDAAAREPQPAQMRFQGMDENRDGRITRAEWRGSDQSFRKHDWNADGILSGDEVRAGAAGQWGDDVDQTRRPEFRNWTARGFTNLDRNRDGRIQRTEWFYDRDGFFRADHNGDGVLTRAEFLSADVEANRDDAFGLADANHDNVITSNEWQWSRRSFARQDQNGDGQLTRRELTNAELQSQEITGGGAVGTSGRAIVINSSRGWVDTGIIVRSGERVSIDASGSVTLSNNGSDVAEPGGSRTGRRAQSAPLPNEPAGALIARIDNGAPILVGNRRAFVANEPGRLYLTVNDDFFNDNTGEYRATVSVGR
jgi:hypothetical protein